MVGETAVVLPLSTAPTDWLIFAVAPTYVADSVVDSPRLIVVWLAVNEEMLAKGTVVVVVVVVVGAAVVDVELVVAVVVVVGAIVVDVVVVVVVGAAVVDVELVVVPAVGEDALTGDVVVVVAGSILRSGSVRTSRPREHFAVVRIWILRVLALTHVLTKAFEVNVRAGTRPVGQLSDVSAEIVLVRD